MHSALITDLIYFIIKSEQLDLILVNKVGTDNSPKISVVRNKTDLIKCPVFWLGFLRGTELFWRCGYLPRPVFARSRYEFDALRTRDFGGDKLVRRLIRFNF